MSHEYKVEVVRDGRWWMIHVPEIDQVTQGRRVSEIVPMAESLIAVSTDQPLTDITVRVVSIEVPGLGDVAARATAIADARNAAAQAAEAAQHDAAEYARALAEAGVPVRDTADLLHVSPQRVSQLATAR
ncbi:HicB family toxin-antitoxin system [Mycobacterium heidelbergense]|uniref:HicB family toxin-antitoxin system n=1 Tax=Mycobacterium heidelbergense TaxID=53376 RepID=UPI003CF0FC26